MVTMGNPATRFGPVAEREYDNAPDWAKDKLAAWLDALPGLDDETFYGEAMAAIHTSALVNSWRGDWDLEHCKASAVHNESERRHHERDGHSEDCTGDTVYSQAFAAVWRSQGHSASAYPPRPCDCGAA